jgi:hypothetical protein
LLLQKTELLRRQGDELLAAGAGVSSPARRGSPLRSPGRRSPARAAVPSRWGSPGGEKIVLANQTAVRRRGHVEWVPQLDPHLA